MSVMQKAVEHFKAQLQEQPIEIDVPEWDTKIYVKPVNGLQRDAIMKFLSEGKYFEAQVEALIQRAKDADGKPIFKRVDKTELMRQVDPDIISRIVSEMKAFDDTIEDADIKN